MGYTVSGYPDGVALATAVRLKLERAGFAPVPIIARGKRPVLPDWQNECPLAGEPTIREWAREYPKATNTGICCEGLRVVDIDRDDPSTAHALLELATRMLGNSPIRSRPGSPRVALIYRAMRGFPRTINRYNVSGLQVLGRGAQIVVDGIHPSDAELACTLVSESIPWNALPSVTEKQISEFLSAAAPILGVDPDPIPKCEARTSARGLLADDMAALAAAVALIPNPDAPDWEAWNDTLGKIHAATNGSDEGQEIARAWSEKSASHSDPVFEERWAHFGTSPYSKAGAGSLFHQAAQHGWTGGKAAPPTESEIDAAFEHVGKQGRLRFLSTEDCDESPSRGYVVKGLIAPRDVGCIFGAPGSGKSVLAPYLGYMVATGQPVFRMRARAGGVLYVAAEDAHGMRGRIAALRRVHGPAARFSLVAGVSDLLVKNSSDHAELKAAVADRKPALVIIDTLAMAFPGLEENTAEAMGRVVQVARSLTSDGAAVILIHHDTKEQNPTPRGHSLFNGALDFAVQLTPRDQGGIARGRMTKNRNGWCNIDLAFRLDISELGIDGDGDPITAPLAVEIANAPPGKERLTPGERQTADILRELLESQGVPEVDGRVTVPERLWRDACDDRRISTGETRDNRSRSFRNRFAELKRKRVVSASGGKVWLAADDYSDAFESLEMISASVEIPGKAGNVPEIPEFPNPGKQRFGTGKTGKPPLGGSGLSGPDLPQQGEHS